MVPADRLGAYEFGPGTRSNLEGGGGCLGVEGGLLDQAAASEVHAVIEQNRSQSFLDQQSGGRGAINARAAGDQCDPAVKQGVSTSAHGGDRTQQARVPSTYDHPPCRLTIQ